MDRSGWNWTHKCIPYNERSVPNLTEIGRHLGEWMGIAVFSPCSSKLQLTKCGAFLLRHCVSMYTHLDAGANLHAFEFWTRRGRSYQLVTLNVKCSLSHGTLTAIQWTIIAIYRPVTSVRPVPCVVRHAPETTTTSGVAGVSVWGINIEYVTVLLTVGCDFLQLRPA